MKTLVFTLLWSVMGAQAFSQATLAQTQTAPVAAQPNATTTAPTAPSAQPANKSQTVSGAEQIYRVNPDAFVCSFYMGNMDWLRLRYVFKLYTTFKVEDSCDSAYFNKITTASITAQLAPLGPAALPIRGGVQRYLMDVNLSPSLKPYNFVGKLRFSEQGQVLLSPFDDVLWSRIGPKDVANAAYYPFTLLMPTNFIWNEGSLAHRLIAPDGLKYLMFAWSNQSAIDITRDKLVELKTRLNLPPDWRYQSFLLNKPLTIKSTLTMNHANKVLYDELGNYYIQYDLD